MNGAEGQGCCGRAARRRRMEIRPFDLDGIDGSMRVYGMDSKPFRIEAEERSEVQEEVSQEERGVVVVADERIKALVAKTAEESAVIGGRRSGVPLHGAVSVCGRRRDMEDAFTVAPSLHEDLFHFFAVFDGHGGPEAAEYCKERLHKAVAEEMRQQVPRDAAQWQSLIRKCFMQMDADLSLNDDSVLGTGTAGTTALVAIITPVEIIVGNCGDSRAVLSRNGTVIPLSHDHKPDRPDELARIEEAGGKVIYWNGHRVLGVLAMSRAIGDGYLKPFVVAEPEITVTQRGSDDECLVIATDGLWDVLSNESACNVARKCLFQPKQKAATSRKQNSVSNNDTGTSIILKNSSSTPSNLSPSAASSSSSSSSSSMPGPATAAAVLTKLALARGSLDNISVLVVDLHT